MNKDEGELILHTGATYGFVFMDTLINEGKITCTGATFDMFNFNGSYLQNYGSISIRNVGRYGFTLNSTSDFRNEKDGQISIAHSIGSAFSCIASEIYNNGLIEIDTVGSIPPPCLVRRT